MRALVLVTCASLLLLVPGASFAATDTSTSPARPSIRVTAFSPLVVTGEKFRPVERVKVRVNAQGTSVVRTVRTSLRGTFTARFVQVSGDRCGGAISVVATAADGRLAKFRLPQFLCPPGNP